MEISKHLFHTITKKAAVEIVISGTNVNYTSYEAPRPSDWRYINIYELVFNHGKQWAESIGYDIRSSYSNCEILLQGQEIEDFYVKGSELDATIQALEWLLKEKS